MKNYVYNGIDNHTDLKKTLSGLRIGLISGPTGLSKDFIPTINILHDNYNLTALFSPEHGIRGNVPAGEAIDTYIDDETGLTVYSLYGKNKIMTEEMLKNVDAVVIDIQDVGVRYYTYLYTMTYAMEACAKYLKKMVVIDRINPLGCLKIEGNVLDERFSSFVGKYDIPVRYAMTIGEFANYINIEKDIGCHLEVVKLKNYERYMEYDDTDIPFVMPSPNIPTLSTVAAYIGTCIFEGTNVSEGRGTTKPFELIGAPWFKSDEVINEMNKYIFAGVKFRKAYFTPSFSKYSGMLCNGLQIHITDKNSFESYRTGLHLLYVIKKLHKEFEWLKPFKEGRPRFIEYLLGTDEVTEDSFNPEAFIASGLSEIEMFKAKRIKYLYY